MWQNFRSTVLDIALSVIFAIAQNDSCAYSLLRQHFWDNADDADNTVEGLTHFNIPFTYSLKTGKPLVFLFPCGYRQKQLPEVFYKKCVLRNFTKLTGKHLCQSLLLKRRLWHRCFSVNFVKFLITALLQNTWQLLLNKVSNFTLFT